MLVKTFAGTGKLVGVLATAKGIIYTVIVGGIKIETTKIQEV